MAGPYASITSPYAPGPGHMDSAFRIADLIGQQGQSAARAQLAKGLMVGNLVGDIGSTVGSIFGARDDAKKRDAENQQIADIIASGQPMDLAKLVREFGVERAKEVYTFVEAALAKQQAGSQAANAKGLQQRHADALKQGADPNAINIERWGEGAPLLPAQMLPDPKVAEAAAAKKKLDEENALVTEISEAMRHGMSRPDAQQYYASKTGGKVLPKDFFPDDPVAPKTYQVTVPGPNGPVIRLATEAEMQQGVREYRAPTGGGSTEQDWVLRGGSTTPIPIPRGTAQPGDVPYTRGMAKRNVTAGDAEALAGFDSSLDDLRVLRDTIAPLDPKTGQPMDIGSTGYVAAAKAWMPSLGVGIGAEEKARQAVIDRVKQVIGKTLEEGVLRKEDEIKYEILPTIKDDPFVVRSKLAGLEAAIQKRKQRRIDALADADYDTSRFEARGGAPNAAASAEAADVAAALKGTDPKTGKPFAPGLHTLEDEQGRKSKWRLMPNGSVLKVP